MDAMNNDVTAPEEPIRGLTAVEAASRLQQYGPNKLPEQRQAGVIALFLRQFTSPFIYILVLAAAVSFIIGQLPSGIFIVAVLLLNAVIGTVQEYGAQKSAAALRNMVRGVAHVVRDGVAQRIDSEELVPGDAVLLASGDKVPGDVMLYSSQDLAVDESMLTGESLAVTKNAHADVAETAPVADRVNACFAGTIITHGRGQAVVTHTALDTELGSIAQHVGQDRQSEPPLMIRIRRFTWQVAALIGIAIMALAGIMALKGGYDAEAMMMMAIGLAVSTIPEGLPAALTVALALGMRRMADHSVIIRKLLAVEALGSCTFICSDKTGTLTVNELTVKKVLLPDGGEYDVSGAGIAPGGEVLGADKKRLMGLCMTGILANESYLDYAGGDWVSDGDIVDVALLVLAKKLDMSISRIQHKRRQLELIPYESQAAMSGSLNIHDDGGVCLHAKGSPEKIMSLCSLMDSPDGPVPIDRDKLAAQFEDLAVHGYRVIAFAHRPATENPASEQLEEMTFLGMVAMIDPIRPEAKDAIARCRAGGVDVAMVTGDHPATAKAIALDLGLVDADAPVVTGTMIQELQDTDDMDGLRQLVLPCRVFARIAPTQKELIVDLFIRDGNFLAVTGDGVNDAPAMRRANAGVAMGKNGTDVAKEVADLIITDDNFASIVDGIEQGRIVYNNIRKVIGLLIATGFSALLLFFLTVAFGLPMPMTAIQLLWLNLVANGLQDVALAFEPKEGHELHVPPRRPNEPVFERHLIEHVLVAGSAMGLLAFGTFYWLTSTGVDHAMAQNLTLMLMVMFGNLHALSSRSETRSLFQIRFFANPFLVLAVPIAQLVHIGSMYVPGLSDVLGLQPISFRQWITLLGVALVFLVVEEGHKFYLRRKAGE